jgi:hypothetical protein
MARLRSSDLYWRNDLTAISAFINADNINSLIEGAGFAGEIGLLSIDLDGNDYWIWERINIVDPMIVIVEYNSIFGRDHAVTVPYDPDFVQSKAHYSSLVSGRPSAPTMNVRSPHGPAFSVASRIDKIGSVTVTANPPLSVWRVAIPLRTCCRGVRQELAAGVTSRLSDWTVRELTPGC